MIRVGVAGWDYADWQGPVYPPRPSRRLDRLAFLSRYVDVIEINSSFYRPVAPRTAASWVRRTAGRPTFAFAAKTHRSWSHEPRESQALITPTLDGLRPLLDAGRLCALLLQFPQSFHHEPRTRDRLERLVEHSRGWPLVVEVRHAGWQSADAVRWFAGLGVGWCVVDQPRVGATTAAPLPRVVGRLGYLRLHGRNTADWFRADAGRDARYDYLYSSVELAQLAETARSMAGEAEELMVIQNNHFRGQALVNALQMKHLLEGRRPGAPQTLVTAYPALQGEVRTEQGRLF